MAFPELFRLDRCLTAMVVDVCHVARGCCHWEVLFSRHAYNWELELFHSFSNYLYAAPGVSSESDSLVWVPDG